MKAAVVGTSGLAIGGPFGGLLFASATPNALEDLLLLTIGTMAAYVSILNLPLRRSEIKKKVNKILSSYISEVQKQMKEDLDAQMKETIKTVNSLVAPFEALCSDQVSRLEASEAKRCSLLNDIRALQAEAANID